MLRRRWRGWGRGTGDEGRQSRTTCASEAVLESPRDGDGGAEVVGIVGGVGGAGRIQINYRSIG